MRLVIKPELIKDLLIDLHELTKDGFNQVKVVDYKSLLSKHQLPIQGIVASTLIKFLIKKEILLERRRGRLGVSWKWNTSYPDFQNIVNRYQAHLNSIHFEVDKKQCPIQVDVKATKPSQFNLGDTVFIMNNNHICKCMIRGMELTDDAVVIYSVIGDYLKLDSVPYKDIFITVDDLINNLKDEFYANK